MTRATVLSVIGPVLDIAGAVLLVKGLLVRDMTVFRSSRAVMEQERALPRSWYLLIPLRLAFRCGSRDLRNTSPALLDDYAATFLGADFPGLGIHLPGSRADHGKLPMIGLAPRGRVRPWKLAAAVTVLQRAFPWREVRCFPLYGRPGYVFVVDRHGALVVSPAVLERCADEAAIEAAIGKGAEFRLELE